MGVEFRKLSVEEARTLREKLRENAETGKPLRMDPLTTGWVPDDGFAAAEETLNAIASVPCHY
jgi:hypothetical protein